jgi:hypothetical protein
MSGEFNAKTQRSKGAEFETEPAGRNTGHLLTKARNLDLTNKSFAPLHLCVFALMVLAE